MLFRADGHRLERRDLPPASMIDIIESGRQINVAFIVQPVLESPGEQAWTATHFH